MSGAAAAARPLSPAPLPAAPDTTGSMEALQVAPASSSSDSLLHLLLRAHRRSEGLLLVELDGCAAAELDALRQQHRAAALQEPGAALQVRGCRLGACPGRARAEEGAAVRLQA